MLPYGYDLLEKSTKAIVLGIGDKDIAFSPPPNSIKLDGKMYKFYGDVSVPKEYWGTLHRIRKYKLN